MIQKHRLLLGVLILAANCGCTHTTAPQVVPGFGTQDVHVGMTAEAIKGSDKSWKEIKSTEYRDKTFLQVQQRGIEVICIHDVVVAVDFFYRYPHFQQFAGQSTEGIGVDSTFRDVICMYGRPTTIGNTVVSGGELSGSREVSFDYPERGIFFEFIDDRLKSISVQRPETNPEAAIFRKDIGDTLELRRIECDGATTTSSK